MTRRPVSPPGDAYFTTPPGQWILRQARQPHKTANTDELGIIHFDGVATGYPGRDRDAVERRLLGVRRHLRQRHQHSAGRNT